MNGQLKRQVAVSEVSKTKKGMGARKQSGDVSKV